MLFRSIKRQTNDEDGRSQKIILTASGQTLFDSVFPSHMKHLEKVFNKLTKQEMTNLSNSLKQLRLALEQTN